MYGLSGGAGCVFRSVIKSASDTPCILWKNKRFVRNGVVTCTVLYVVVLGMYGKLA